MASSTEIRIAEKAHHEGRRAYKEGKYQKDNPYNNKEVVNSDGWLRYINWRNGWTFAWFTDPARRTSWKKGGINARNK